MNVFSKVFGTHSQREVKRIMPLVEKTEALRPEMQKLTDEELRDKTREYKRRLEEGATTRRSSSGGFCHSARGSQACSWNGALPCPDHRRYHPSSGTNCGNENR